MQRKYEMNLEKLGITIAHLSGALTNYFQDAVKVHDVEIEDESLGSMYNVYTLNLSYTHEQNGNEKKNIKLIAKHYRNLNGASNQSSWNRQRRDSLIYERAILENLDNVPRYVYSNKNILIMEYLGKDDLESMFLNPEKRNRLLQENFLDDLVAGIAKDHEKLPSIVINQFKNTSSVDYNARFLDYLNDIWIWKNKSGSLSKTEFERQISDSFSVISDILSNGTVTGQYTSNSVIHQDLHPGHVFYKEEDGRLTSPYFIDFKPRTGPVQFDLVDIIAHPLISPFIDIEDEKLDDLIEHYLIESLKVAGLGKGINISVKLQPSIEVVRDFKAVLLPSRFYRDIRGASKSCGMEVNDPEIYEQYIRKDEHYPDLKFSYMADAVRTLSKMTDENRELFRFNSGELMKLNNLGILFRENFRDEINKGDILLENLGILKKERVQ